MSNFNTEKVESFHGMFSECSSLAEINIKNFNSQFLDEDTIMFYDVAEKGRIVYNSDIFDGDFLKKSLANWELEDVYGKN